MLRRLPLALSLAALALPLAAQALDMPKRKSGLWEIKTSGEGMPGQTIQQCVDAASDQLLAQRAGGMGKQQCSKNDVSKQGNKMVVDSVCKFGQTTSTTHAEFSGDFESAYKADMATKFDPPLMGRATSNSTIEARWTGPCKPGQKPGDMIMPGMGNINLNDMLKNLPQR